MLKTIMGSTGRFKYMGTGLVLLSCLLVSAAAAASSLNDTDETLCYDGNGNAVSCTAAGVDDDSSDRDAAAAAGVPAKIGTGAAGFDFTKIANNGSELSASAALGSNPGDWACTRDNITGLTWEVKTTDGGLRDRNNTYTWYDNNNGTNGGDAGSIGGNTCNSTLPSGQCNTAAFVAAVNMATLCGAGDWRLPTVRELFTIVHQGAFNPSIDATYFPNTVESSFWSATTYVPIPSNAWFVYFLYGYDYANLKSYGYYVRLVRGGQ